MRNIYIFVEVFKLVMMNIVPIDQITLFSLDFRVRNPPNRVHLRLLRQSTIIRRDVFSLPSFKSAPLPMHTRISFLSKILLVTLLRTLIEQFDQIFAPLQLSFHKLPLLHRQRVAFIFAILNDLLLLLVDLLLLQHLLGHPLELYPHVDSHTFFRQVLVVIVVDKLIYWDQVRGQVRRLAACVF